jgi:predicted nuclease with TOPRIM domain
MNIISALINLVKFTEEQQDFVVNLQERSNNVVEERDRLDSEIEQMKEQISRIKYGFVSLLSYSLKLW